MANFVLQMLLFILQDEDKVNRSHRWPITVNSLYNGHCRDLELGGNYMRPGRTRTDMSRHHSPYTSFHAFTWDQPKNELRAV